MYKNHEGYADPTAGAAVANVTREGKQKSAQLKWVYIASPYHGNVEANTERARRYCYFAVRQSCVPACPHIFITQFLDDSDKEEREAGLYLGLQMLQRCEELWVFGTYISEGMRREIAEAKRRGILIRRFNISCEEVDSDGSD
jgi:hypothetical protein